MLTEREEDGTMFHGYGKVTNFTGTHFVQGLWRLRVQYHQPLAPLIEKVRL
jgi:hypothetical protein